MSDLEKKVLVLTSNVCLKRDQKQNQMRAFSLLESKHIPFESIDGSLPENKQLRNELFQISGMGAVYPQFFLVYSDDTVSFLGDWDTIEGLNDASALPSDVLDANPAIVTWERVLGAAAMHAS